MVGVHNIFLAQGPSGLTPLFVAVGTNIGAWSTDGINWTKSSMPTGDWRSVTYSPTLNRWVAVSNLTTGNLVSYSDDDGQTFSLVSSTDFGRNLQCVKWCSGFNSGDGLFVAVSDRFTAGDNVWTSPDGLTWTQQGFDTTTVSTRQD